MTSATAPTSIKGHLSGDSVLASMPGAPLDEVGKISLEDEDLHCAEEIYDGSSLAMDKLPAEKIYGSSLAMDRLCDDFSAESVRNSDQRNKNNSFAAQCGILRRNSPAEQWPTGIRTDSDARSPYKTAAQPIEVIYDGGMEREM